MPRGTDRAAATRTPSSAFSAEERAAMNAAVAEAKTARARANTADTGAADEADVLEKIATMDGTDRALAETVHALVKEIAPDLAPRLWYGMPAYARGPKVLCHFQERKKFKTRYATLGFSDAATMDDGEMWPVAYALTEVSESVETRIRELLAKAAGGGR